MFSVAALIEDEPIGPLKSISEICDASSVATHPSPHFSWQTAESYQLDGAREHLSKLAETVPPFKFSTSGFGVFSNDHKIIFLIIVKTKQLFEIHEFLWNELSKYANNRNKFYSPENWIPHISLNLHPITENQFNCIFTGLNNKNLQFEFLVKKLGLLYMNEYSFGVDSIFNLKGAEKNE